MSKQRRRLTEVRNVNVLRDLEGRCCTKLLAASFPLFITTVSIIPIMAALPIMAAAWCQWIINALGFAMAVGQHVDLSQVGYLHHHCVIISWQRLLPWLPVYPHVCVCCLSFVELKPNPMCLC